MSQSLDQNKEKHVSKFLENCFKAINNFSASREGKITLPLNYPIENCSIKIEKREKEDFFTYKLELQKIISFNDTNFHNFGFNESAEITFKNDSVFLSPTAVVSIDRTLGKPKHLTGKIAEIHSKNPELIQAKFHRLIIASDREALTTIIQSYPYNDEHVSYSYGLASLSVDKNKYHLFRHENRSSKKHFLLVDSLQESTYFNFQKETSSLIKSFGLITGNWYGGERFVVSSSDYQFREIEFVHYFHDLPKITSHSPLVDPFQFVQYMKAYGKELKLTVCSFPAEVLSNIATMICHDDDLHRALFLILEARHAKPPILKSCTSFVAIETLSSIISKAHKDYFKPIKSPKTESEIIKQITVAFEAFEKTLPMDEYSTLKKKIANLNSPSNMDKMLKSFSLFNITLTTELADILKSRNLYLHGKTSEKDDDPEKSLHQAIVAQKVHLLACILFLKHCGYSGHIKNLAGELIFNLNKHRPDFQIEDPVFHQI